MNTPFRVGSVVSPGDYIEPQKSDLISIAQYIFNGESLAVTGDPRIGKTSLLTYFSSPNVVRGLNSVYREWKMVFRFMDYHLFQDNSFTLREFWQVALTPIFDIFNKVEYPTIHAACQRWATEGSNFALTHLFSVLSNQRIRLVLCIDEFDDILSHPTLGSETFLGALRAIATREPSLTLIISSRLEVNELNERTNRNRRPGSPFFNHFIQIILGCFSTESASLLLDRAREVFSERDKSLLLFMVGRHPYFLQIAASALWDQYKLFHEANPEVRFREVWKKLCIQALSTLDDSWSFWSIRTKQVFAIIALEDIPKLIKTKSFDIKSLSQELSTCVNELMFLELRGYIEKNKENKYVLSSFLLLYWLALKLDTSIQKGDELGNWLMTEHRGAVLKAKHREKIIEIGRAIARVVETNQDLFLRVILENIMK